MRVSPNSRSEPVFLTSEADAGRPMLDGVKTFCTLTYDMRKAITEEVRRGLSPAPRGILI